MAELKDIQFFGVTSLSTALVPNALYFVLKPNTTSFELYITDLSGVPIPILDKTTTGSVLSVTGTAVTGTSTNPKVDIATLVSSQLNNQVYLSLSDGKLQVNPITSPDNSIEVTSTSLELQIQLSAAIQTQINSALQSGANISELTNDTGYLTLADIDATDLSYTPSATNGTVNSSTGTDATIPLAGALNAGLLSPSEKSDIASAIQPSDLATVATTGEYSDLLNSPQTKTEFNSELTDGDFLFVGDITQYTDELAQDAVGAILTDTGTVDLTYNDGSNTISAEVKPNSIEASHLADDINISEFVNDEGFESAAQLNVRDTNNRNRANHTGIQLSSTIVDFDIAATAAVVENTITDGVTNKAPSENAVFDALDLKTTVSVGAVSGFALTNNGDGTVNLASGIAYLRATNDPYATIIKYPISAVTNLALTDNANNYVLVDYNGGSPSITVTTNASTINTQTNSLAYVIARVGNDLEYISLVGQNVDPNAKLRIRFLNQEGIRRASGAVLGFSNRNLTLTSSVLFSGLIRINAAAFNTASPDTFTLLYNNGSTWTRTTGQTQVNNTQYNVSGTLTTMPNNTFRTDYVYLLPNNPSKLYVVLGTTTYGTLDLAKTAPRPSSLPVELQVLGLEVGRLFIEKSSATIADTQSSFDVIFEGGSVPDHNSLSGLQGGTAGQYNHLTDAQVLLLDNLDLQAAYLEGNQITTTSLGAVTIQRGSAADTDNIIVGKNGAGTTTFSVSGSGVIDLANISLNSTNGFITKNGQPFIHNFYAAANPAGGTGNNLNVGYDSGNFNSDNKNYASTMVGFESGKSNKNGYSNTGVGYYALRLNENGYGNTALGTYVLGDMVSGNANTSTGWHSSLLKVSGNYNSIYGVETMQANTIGSFNTAFGANSGYNNITGSSNVFLGYAAGLNELGSNKLYISNSSTNDPLIKGDFSTGELELNAGLTSKLKLSSPQVTLTALATGGTYQDFNFNAYDYRFLFSGTQKASFSDLGYLALNTTSANSLLHLKQPVNSFTGGIKLEAFGSDTQMNIFYDGTSFNFDSTYGSTGSYSPIKLRTSSIDRVTLNASGVVDFSEIPTAPTATVGTTGNQIATLDYVLATTVFKGAYTTTGAATTTFTVPIGRTMANTSYVASPVPTNTLSAVMFSVQNKTTTTFDIVVAGAGLTGTVSYDFTVTP